MPMAFRYGIFASESVSKVAPYTRVYWYVLLKPSAKPAADMSFFASATLYWKFFALSPWAALFGSSQKRV